jgi:hypothetical protein
MKQFRPYKSDDGFEPDIREEFCSAMEQTTLGMAANAEVGANCQFTQPYL